MDSSNILVPPPATELSREEIINSLTTATIIPANNIISNNDETKFPTDYCNLYGVKSWYYPDSDNEDEHCDHLPRFKPVDIAELGKEYRNMFHTDAIKCRSLVSITHGGSQAVEFMHGLGNYICLQHHYSPNKIKQNGVILTFKGK